jgi:hypothetical protein
VLPARFLGQMAVPIGLSEVIMHLLDSLSSLKSLKIRFELRAVALTNLATFGEAAGLLYWR